MELKKELRIYEDVYSERIIACPSSKFEGGGFFETPLIETIPLPYTDQQLADLISAGLSRCNQVTGVFEDSFDRKPLYRAFGAKKESEKIRNLKLVSIEVFDEEYTVYGGVPNRGGYAYFANMGLDEHLPLDADMLTLATTVRKMLNKVKPHK